MITVPVALLYIMFIREFTPVCKKVESPITATQSLMYSLPLAFSIPWRLEMLAPIQMVVSTTLRGATAPSV